jgi:DnaJ-class molecular chaperone
VNPNSKDAEARFKEINEAYEVLSDEEKRKKYDKFGADWEQYERMGAQAPSDFDFSRWAAQQGYASGGPQSYRTYGGTMPGGAGFSDFFEMLFGQQMGGGMGGVGGGSDPFGRLRTGTRTVTRRGEDVTHPIEVTLEEAYTGTSRRLQFQVEDPCPTCGGVGVVARVKTIEAKIPAGVHSGSVVRLAGEGAPGAGGAPRGDLRLEVTVLPHPRYERKGDNLHLNVPVSLYTAILGGEARVSTLRGTNLALRIPPDTANGRVIRLAGQGMPHLGAPDQKGDLLARVDVQLPQQLTDEERDLFTRLQRIYTEREGGA